QKALTSLQFNGNQFNFEVEEILKEIIQKRDSLLDTESDSGNDTLYYDLHKL
ncbi:17459_t:CDS:1, partial [Racocetra persica]